MAWAIAIVCVSMSCERIPDIAGWFDEHDECISTARMVVASWQPTVGFYHVSCQARAII